MSDENNIYESSSNNEIDTSTAMTVIDSMENSSSVAGTSTIASDSVMTSTSDMPSTSSLASNSTISGTSDMPNSTMASTSSMGNNIVMAGNRSMERTIVKASTSGLANNKSIPHINAVPITRFVLSGDGVSSNNATGCSSNSDMNSISSMTRTNSIASIGSMTITSYLTSAHTSETKSVTDSTSADDSISDDSDSSSSTSEPSSSNITNSKKSKREFFRTNVENYIKHHSFLGGDKTDLTLSQTKSEFMVQKMMERDLSTSNSFSYSNILCITNNQQMAYQQFGRFSRFVESEKGVVKTELRRFYGPMICHLYFELLKANELKAAKIFLKKYANLIAPVETYDAPFPKKVNGCSVPSDLHMDPLGISYCNIKFVQNINEKKSLELQYFMNLIETISICTNMETATKNKDVCRFLSTKYEIHTTDIVVNALFNFLSTKGHVLILNIIYTWIHIQLIGYEAREWTGPHLLNGFNEKEFKDNVFEDFTTKLKPKLKPEPKTEIRTKSKSKSETGTDVISKSVAESIAERVPESKTESQQELKQDFMTEIKSSIPESNPDLISNIIPDTKIESISKSNPESRIEPKPDSIPEIVSESKPESKLDPKSEVNSKLVIKEETESCLKVESESKVEPERNLEPELKVETEPILQTKAESKAETKTEQKQELRKETEIRKISQKEIYKRLLLPVYVKPSAQKRPYLEESERIPNRQINVRACLQYLNDAFTFVTENVNIYPQFIKIADRDQGITSGHIDGNRCHLVAGFNNSVVQLWQLDKHTDRGKNIYRHMQYSTCCWEINNYFEEEQDEIDLDMQENLNEEIKIEKEKFFEAKYEDNSYNEFGGIMLRGHGKGITDVRFSRHHPILYSTSIDCTLRTWRADTYSCAGIYSGHNYPVWCFDESPVDMHVATGSRDNTARLWHLERYSPVITYVGHTQDVQCVAFHPNGNYLATGSSDCSVRLWCVTSGKLMRVFCECKQAVWTVAFSPDGKMLAAGGAEGIIRIFDLAAGSQLCEMSDHNAVISGIVWSNNGNILAAIYVDGKFRLWDVKNLQRETGNSATAPSLVPFSDSEAGSDPNINCNISRYFSIFLTNDGTICCVGK